MKDDTEMLHTMASEALVGNMIAMCGRLVRGLREATVMLQVGREEGLHLTAAVQDALRELEPRGESESKLMLMIGEIDALKAALYESGIRVSYDECQARITKIFSDSS